MQVTGMNERNLNIKLEWCEPHFLFAYTPLYGELSSAARNPETNRDH